MRSRAREGGGRRPAAGVMAGLLLALALAVPGNAASRITDSGDAITASYHLQLHDDDTGDLLGNRPTRQLLAHLHSLLEHGRVAAIVKLIPKPYKSAQRAIFRKAKLRRRALLLLSLHLNNDQNNLVYPGFVHRCTAHSDYSRYDISDLKRLGLSFRRSSPCRAVWRYHGPVLRVNYWSSPRSRRGQPYFRGLLLP